MMVKRRLWILSLAVVLLAGNALTATSQPATSGTSLPGVREARFLTVAQDGTGSYWAAWEVESGTDIEIYYSRWTGKGWSAPRPVHSRPQAQDHRPSLAATADGEVWLAWTSAEKSDPERSKLYVSRWAGRRWTDPEAVPMDTIQEAKHPALAAPALSAPSAASGTPLWLAWAGLDGTDYEIFVSRWDGSSWLAPEQVSADDDKATLGDRQPQIAVGQDGRPWLVWTSHQGGVDDEISFSRWTGDGWTPEGLVSRDDNALDLSPSLALDAQGQPWVAWEGTLLEGVEMRSRILLARWDASRSAWTDEVVASSPLASDVYESSPTIAPAPGGQMHLAWVAGSAGGSALVHAPANDGHRTEPQLLATGVADEAAVLTFAADGSAVSLYLAPPFDAGAPVRSAAVEKGLQPLSTWLEEQALLPQPFGDPVWNRHMAFGDSITWGQYVDLLPEPGELIPYPVTLEQALDTRVVESEVVNRGVPGNSTKHGVDRIKPDMETYKPQYLLYMMGTNDVSRDVEITKVRNNIEWTITLARHSGVSNLRILIATLIPRVNGAYNDTAEMNEEAILEAAEDKNVPVCDQWQAFHDYGPWQDILVDGVHPDQTGLDLVAETFYGCLIDNWLIEDTIPPETWIEPLPVESECGSITVEWNGTDTVSYVVDYDVQAKVNTGSWTDWQMATQDTSAVYSGGYYYDILYFRVRGRDVAGNENSYSAAEWTTIMPMEAHIFPLPAYQTSPFLVSWKGSHGCNGINGYEVEYRIGESGVWQDWLTFTTATYDTFTPEDPPQYGERYYFRARAQDGNLTWSNWSDPPAYTTLARYGVSGTAYNVRHEPVIGAQATLAPPAEDVQSQIGGRFTAYLMSAGDYGVDVSRDDKFGALPPMHVPVSDHVEGLQFVLPPQDDVVFNGGFETGGDPLSGWEASDTVTLTLPVETHTGDGAARLGGLGQSSSLTQTVPIPGILTDATLSFLARLDDDDDGSSELQIELDGASISQAEPISAGDWIHVSIPVDVAASQTVTLTFTVTDNPPVRLDEVSLGSALPGGSTIHLPLIGQHHNP
jgi:lysophospholipase L1-like esterase